MTAASQTNFDLFPVVFLRQYFVAGFFSQLRDSVIFPLFVWNSPTADRRQLAWTNFGSRGATVIRSKEGGGSGTDCAPRNLSDEIRGRHYLFEFLAPPPSRDQVSFDSSIHGEDRSHFPRYGINQMASQ